MAKNTTCKVSKVSGNKSVTSSVTDKQNAIPNSPTASIASTSTASISSMVRI